MPKSSMALPVKKKPASQPPHIFGLGMRDRLLMTLAVNSRPLYVAELTDLLQSDDRKIRNTISVLTECGVIVRDKKSSSGRYLALNKGLSAYRELLILLRALAIKNPQTVADRPARRAERLALKNLDLQWNAGPYDASAFDRLFYSKVRTRVLLAISAAGSTDVTDIDLVFSESKRSAWNAVNHWQREGLIRSRVVGRRRALDLDPTFYAAKELRAFLRAIRRVAGEYDRLAEFSVRKPTSPKFIAIR